MNTSYFIRRIGQAVLTFLLAVTLSFVLYQMLPGGPEQAIQSAILSNAGSSVDIERINRLVDIYTNIDRSQPVYLQYTDYLSQILFHGDFGQSFYEQEAVSSLILERLPWSVFITMYALTLGYTISIVFGIIAAYREKSRLDSVISISFITVNSVPYYIVGVLAIYVFSLQLDMLPRGGRMSSGIEAGFTVTAMVDMVQHAILPAVSMGALATSGVLTLRGNAIRVLGEGYVRVAELRGLRESRIVTRYIGQNSILPMYTRFMTGIAGVLSSAVLVEEIFSYPGIGLLTYTAVMTQDYPLLMGTLIVFTTIAIIGILIADFTYGFVDPRISTGGRSE